MQLHKSRECLSLDIPTMAQVLLSREESAQAPLGGALGDAQLWREPGEFLSLL